MSIRELVHRTRQDSLYRNSSYSLISMVTTAAFGFVCSLLCTRLFPQDDVGYAAAMLGSVTLAVALSNLGTSRTILRFHAQSANKVTDLFMWCTIVAITAVITALALVFGGSRLGVIPMEPLLALAYVLAVLISAVKVLFDCVFVATRRASGMLAGNLSFGIARTATLVACTGMGYFGIFSASLVAVAVAVVFSGVLLFRHGELSLRPVLRWTSVQGRLRFTGGSYVADLIGGLPASLVPLILVTKAGPVDAAIWFTVMQVINFMMMISSSINQVMFAEMAHAPSDVAAVAKRASLAMYALVTPLAVCVVVFRSAILSVFSPGYARGDDVLGLLAIFALVGVSNYITGSLIAHQKRVLYLTFVNAMNAAVTIGYCLLFADDLSDFALGWVLGEVVNAVLFVGGCVYFVRRDRKVLSRD